MMFFWTVPLYALPFRCLANSTACAFRHRRSGVPLSLHSFGTLRAPPWRRTSPRKIHPTKPRHPELDSGSVPPSMALYRLARKSKKSLQQSPVTLNLIQGLYRRPWLFIGWQESRRSQSLSKGPFFKKTSSAKAPGIF